MASGPAFRILGIPVRIDPTFFVIVALLGFTGDLQFLLIWVPIVTVSILVHELGHAIAFRAFGKQPQILLQGMGGLTSATGSLSPSRELVVSLAGPLTGLVLIGLPALWFDTRVAATSSDLDTALRILVFVNIAWSIVNLLPILPLDGGRVTASVLHVVTRRPAEKATHVISVAVAGAAGLWAYADGQVFLAAFAGFFVAFNLAQLAHFRNRSRAVQLGEGYQALGRGDDQGALELARNMAATSNSAVAVAQAIQLQAWALLLRGEPDEAEEALRRFPPRASPTRFLTGALKLARNDDGWRDELTGAYTEGQPSPGGPVRAGDTGPWTVIAAELVARAGGVDALAQRLAAADDRPTASAALRLLQVDLHRAGRYDESVRVGEQGFALAADSGAAIDAASAAYDAACSLARMGQTADALTWLERAVEHGFADRVLLDEDPDLDALRHTPDFDALREGIT